MPDFENLRLIRDSAAAIAPRGGDLRRIRALRFTEPGFDPAVLQQMGEMGWIGLRVAEEKGGAGLGMAEFCAVLEECGAALVPEPLLPCATAALLHPDAALLAGQRVVVPAWQERPDVLDQIPETALANGRVTGRKLFVPMAGAADAFILTTAQGLALVERSAPGVTIETARTQDGGHVATVDFADTPATAVPGEASDALEEATLATSAMLLGVMGQAFVMTLEYLKTRQQFGKPIGSFQSLQHRAADLKLQLELTRASVESAAAVLDAGAPKAQRQAAVSRAKARASTAGMLVTRQAIQLHGGIGYTDEYDVGLYLRKAMVLSNAYGSAAAHRARYARLVPDDED
ncbi:acyl-CoA dehydrogenase family protein [Acidisphaera sp. L21]|uniref:acyl-CoA dehydrogenase family protein n=1 Tax=Acidisphaera sp. L21 TaxID=1641851 RepID=UPI001C20498B|nr:acyl-CoA dehydrogenase family protein [Acidisphaera sp. L21]